MHEAKHDLICRASKVHRPAPASLSDLMTAARDLSLGQAQPVNGKDVPQAVDPTTPICDIRQAGGGRVGADANPCGQGRRRKIRWEIEIAQE